jgi:hypothetical protein
LIRHIASGVTGLVAATPSRAQRFASPSSWCSARPTRPDEADHPRCWPCWTTAARPAFAQDKSIVVASTTSTQDSGLFEYLLPLYKKKTGVVVKVIAQGTGQALDTGRRGDADVVFVHPKSAELKFLAEGQGVRRYLVMYNDFVLIGPDSLR